MIEILEKNKIEFRVLEPFTLIKKNLLSVFFVIILFRTRDFQLSNK